MNLKNKIDKLKNQDNILMFDKAYQVIEKSNDLELDISWLKNEIEFKLVWQIKENLKMGIVFQINKKYFKKFGFKDNFKIKYFIKEISEDYIVFPALENYFYIDYHKFILNITCTKVFFKKNKEIIYLENIENYALDVILKNWFFKKLKKQVIDN